MKNVAVADCETLSSMVLRKPGRQCPEPHRTIDQKASQSATATLFWLRSTSARKHTASTVGSH